VPVLATSEELIFRTVVLNHLRPVRKPSGTVVAIVASSMVFSLAHAVESPIAWLSLERVPLMIGLILLGVLLSAVYVSTASISCAIGVHAALLGSKVVLRKTHLVEFTPTGWWFGEAGDLRTAPVVWLVFSGLAAFFLLFSNRIRPFTAVEADRFPDRPTSNFSGPVDRSPVVNAPSRAA